MFSVYVSKIELPAVGARNARKERLAKGFMLIAVRCGL